MLSTFPTLPAVMPRSSSRKPRCPLLNDWSTGALDLPRTHPKTRRQPAVGSQLDDEGPQQRQEAPRCPHCCPRFRDHPSPHRPEPHPSLSSPSGGNAPSIDLLTRFSLMLSSTLAPGRTLPVSVHRVLSVARLSMSRPFAESTSRSPSSPSAWVHFCISLRSI